MRIHPHSVVISAILSLAFIYSLPAFSQSLYDFWDETTENTDSYYFVVNPGTGKSFDNNAVFLEISTYEDFSFVEKSFPMSAYKYNASFRECTIKFSNIPKGTYFYRAAVYPTTFSATTPATWTFKVYPTDPQADVKKITKGTMAPRSAYVQTPDEETYPEMELADGRLLNIESVWLRSALNGQPLMPATPTGLDPAKKARKEYEVTATLFNPQLPPYDSFSHGAIVKNGIIYIGVGSSANFNPAVTYKSATEQVATDPDRTMIYRYDLSSGEFLKPIRVKDENGKEFDYKNYRVMPWLRTDDDETPYFLCAPLYNSYKALDEYATTAYTVDFSKIEEGTGPTASLKAIPTSAGEELHLLEKETDYLFGTISGSLSKGNYTVWGMRYDRQRLQTELNSWATDIKTWNISSKYAGEPKVYSMDRNPFSTADEEAVFSSYTPKVYPIDDTHAYTHATPILNMSALDLTQYANYEPAFYQLEGSKAILKNKLSDATTPDMPSAAETRRMSGFPIIKIGETVLAAYGHQSSSDNATAVQIVQLIDPAKGFEEGNLIPLWDLFGKNGLSTSPFQALDMTFIPAAATAITSRAGDDGHLGHLLVYAAGGGMGLYRISETDSGLVTSFPEINADRNISVVARQVNCDSDLADVELIDMQGRILHTYPLIHAGTTPLPRQLSPGIYMLRTPHTIIKFKY